MIMWIQMAMPLLGFAVLLIFLGGTIDIGDAGRLPLLVLGVGVTVLIGVLAACCRTRRKWVRITAFAVEGLVILEEGYAFVAGSSVNGLISLFLAVVVVFQLSRPAASAWFDR
ncbi:hypothetical protein [Streptosporangium sp. NPDC023615]|uniref:hypothetical protein n=1 Tax=Streptosporangium sp. NPDC023615 TaxID=3154794 RepID=UPI0034469022